VTATLALGTYRIPAADLTAAAERAAAAPAPWIDTAPNYAKGQAHRLLAPALRAHPQLRVATKAGFLTLETARAALEARVIDPPAAQARHSLAAAYVHWQTERARAELGRDRLDTVFVHNPERAPDPRRLHGQLRDAFVVLEEQAASGRIGTYGVATWTGFKDALFTVTDLDRIAREAAGTQDITSAPSSCRSASSRTPPCNKHCADVARLPTPPTADGTCTPPHPSTEAPSQASTTTPNLPTCSGPAPRPRPRASRPPPPAPASPRFCCPPPMRDTGRPRLPRSTSRPFPPTSCGRSSMYSPPPDPTDAERMATAHTRAAAALGSTASGPLVWGYQGRTLGRHATHRLHGACWLRLQAAPTGKEGGKHWEGQEHAAHLFPTVRKPTLHAIRDATIDGYAYRAELFERVDDPVLCPDGPVLRHELDLPDVWFKRLREDLDTIAATATGRAALRQEWIDRAVPQFTGRPAPQITDWTCAHGDLHLANITTGAVILDWEGFGLAPRGWDAALLYAYSLLPPATAARIHAAFADTLDTQTGRTAQLIAAADLLQSCSRGDHPELTGPLRKLVETLP
jgi:hypothetical protein